MCCRINDLQWPGKVERVELWVQGKQDVNGVLIGYGRRLVGSHGEAMGCVMGLGRLSAADGRTDGWK